MPLFFRSKPTHNNNNNNEKPAKEVKKLYEDAPRYLVPPDDPQLLQSVNILRQRMRIFCEENEEKICADDYKKLMSCDYEIRRYLFQAKLDEEIAYEMLRERLIWRKEYGFEGADPSRFPIEFFQMAGVFPHGADLDGDPILYVRSRFNLKVDIFEDPIRKFLVYNMDKMDQIKSHERSWGLFFDAQGFGFANVDIEFLIFIVKVLRQYICWSVKYIVIYEIPWYLESVWKAVQVFIPEDGKRVIRIYNKNTIHEVIDPDKLPYLVGGKDRDITIDIPKGCRPATECAKIELELDDEQIKKYLKQFEKLLKEIPSDLNYNYI